MARISFNEATIATRKLQTAYTREIQKAYQTALDEIRTHIAQASARYGDLTLETMQKKSTVTLASGRKVSMQRLEILERTILTDMANLSKGETQHLASHLTDVYVQNYEIGAKNIENILRRDISFNVLNREAIYQSAINPLTQVALDARRQNAQVLLRRELTQGIVQGQGARDIGKRIETVLNKSANDALRIARTETTGIQNKARLELGNDALEKGIKLQKQWISTLDDRTRTFDKGDRADHQEMNNEIAGVNDLFSNGLLYPADQSAGKPEETINCRCTMGYIIED